MPRRTRAKDLRRRVETRRERRTVVIFCEGKKSEPDYLQGVKRLPEVRRNTAVNIEIASKRDVPLPLVVAAVKRKQDDEVDDVWCVFDVEAPQQHPDLKQAMHCAAEHGIRVAVSNPCFELWLILHHQHHTAALSTAQAENLRGTLDGRPGKQVDPDRYLPNRRLAAQRASALAERHVRNGTSFPNNNPSSTVGDLLAAIEP